MFLALGLILIGGRSATAAATNDQSATLKTHLENEMKALSAQLQKGLDLMIQTQLTEIQFLRDAQIAVIRTRMTDAVAQVEHIANQPVTPLDRMSEMNVTIYPVWFRPGGAKPDFNKVDVRTTRQLVYDAQQYVASEENPGVVFLGRELEYNPMIKYFYTNSALPKKRLTEAEMLDINQYYRVIGYCEQQLAELPGTPPTLEERKLAEMLLLEMRPKPEPVWVMVQRLMVTLKHVAMGIAAVIVVIVVIVVIAVIMVIRLILRRKKTPPQRRPARRQM
jgi:hypothetical protein